MEFPLAHVGFSMEELMLLFFSPLPLVPNLDSLPGIDIFMAGKFMWFLFLGYP